eukprot:Phypoly_transcript_16520.p1 GENE.Phypoly_transcript_16520~~Phypoly_transcript_16520.p1  ORF type:complete len:118 (-),score=9.90 Phypoly_transcript_16520:506-859(-)
MSSNRFNLINYLQGQQTLYTCSSGEIKHDPEPKCIIHAVFGSVKQNKEMENCHYRILPAKNGGKPIVCLKCDHYDETGKQVCEPHPLAKTIVVRFSFDDLNAYNNHHDRILACTIYK